MATLFEDLFDDFLSTEVSSLDLRRYTPPALSKYLTTLLKRAREEFYSLIYNSSSSSLNKMDDVIDFYSQEYSYTHNNSADFIKVLSPLPQEGSLFYASINDEETLNYSYDDNIGEITIQNMPSTYNSIDIVAYKNGQFNQNLNIVEQGIILDWMGVIFQKDKIKEQKLYNIAIYGRDTGMHSQAQHLKSLNDIYINARKDVVQKTYTYTYQHNPNLLAKLGGKG